jgi:hypothetical protein
MIASGQRPATKLRHLMGSCAEHDLPRRTRPREGGRGDTAPSVVLERLARERTQIATDGRRPTCGRAPADTEGLVQVAHARALAPNR